MPDTGLTHIALPVSDMERSLAFYARYAKMEVVHRRPQTDRSREVAWINDGTRPFVVVLLQVDTVDQPLAPNAHLGVACASRDEMDQLCRQAEQEGVLLQPPTDSGPPVGYWAFLKDPDGHTLELSYGQEVAQAVADARR